MHLTRRWRGWCAPMMAGLAMATSSWAGEIYVDPTATLGDDDGSNWANAYLTLEKALCHASRLTNDEIRVRGASGTFDGVYVPSGDYSDTSSGCIDCEIAEYTGRDRHFRLKHNVKLYGGFEGSEDLGFNGLVDRVPKIQADSNPTTLEGEFGANPDDHVYHVVVSQPDCGLETTPLHYLDGFHVEGGWASGEGQETPNDVAEGGGIYRDHTAIAIVLCSVHDNWAGDAVAEIPGAGGGMAVLGTFGLSGTPNVDIVDCTSASNAVLYASPNANADVGGGAIYIKDETSGRTKIVNTLMHDNVVGGEFSGQGGAIALLYGGMDLYNCTIMDNAVALNEEPSYSLGGGIAIGNSTADATLTNTIVWGNSASTDGGIHLLANGSVAVQGSDIQDGQYAGQDGNISVDPNVDGAYHLAFPSPCIDAGLNAPLVAIPDTYDLDKDTIADGADWEVTPDRDIMPRIVNWCVDMGAYEFMMPCATDLDEDMMTGFSDLLLLLGYWGPCRSGEANCELPDTSTSPPQSIADCIAKVGFNHPDKLQACIEAMILNGTP